MTNRKQLLPPPVIRGWNATPEEREQALKENKMLHIYAGTSNMCNLGCIYCHTAGGRPLPGEMTLEERLDVLRQAKQLGCKYVHISGAGEPTIDPLLWKQIDYINKHDMIPTVFTHAKDVDMDLAKRFYDNNCSVVIKMHSAKEDVQDYYAGVPGYTKKRLKSIENLMAVGLNASNPTRLGADIMITNDNKEEIPGIFRWARDNNIFPLVKSIICMERATQDEVQRKLKIHPKDVEKIFYNLLHIDEEEYGYTWTPAPPWAGVHCDYNYYHAHVSIQGNIKPCIGFSPVGNIRDRQDALIYYWNDPMMKRVRRLKHEIKGICATCKENCYGCPCRRVAREGSDEAAFTATSCWEANL